MPLVPATRQDNRFVVVGIDPGTNSVGFSRIEIDCFSWEIKEIWATTLHVDKLQRYDGFVLGPHAERTGKLLKLRQSMTLMLNWARPHHVCCESPFYNRLRPGAYGPLVEAIFALKMASFDHDPLIPFTTLEPSTIKKAMGAGAIARKEKVKEAVMENMTVIKTAIVDVDQLDEHAIDAIAVGYSHWHLFLREN